MIDRQKIECILHRRFPGAPLEHIAAAVNAIMGLTEECDDEAGTDRRTRRRRGATRRPVVGDEDIAVM